MKSIRYIVLFISILTSSLAFGDEKLNQAQELAFQAQLAIDEGKFIQSIKLYQKAYQLHADQEFLFAIASLYRRVDESCTEELNSWKHFFDQCLNCSRYDEALKRREQAYNRCFARLKVSCQPIASVFINGLLKGRSPQEISMLTPGKYEVQCSEHESKASQTVELKAAQVQEVRLTLLVPMNKGLTKQTVGWGLTGGGVATLGVGLYFLLHQLPDKLAQRDAEFAQLLPKNLASSNDHLTKLKTLDEDAQNAEILGWVSLSLSAAFFGGAYLLWPQDQKESSNVLTPSIGPDASLQWSW